MPFWNAQIGVQYANEWMAEGYQDRWSGVLAPLGLAPGMFEVDASMYVSQHANVTFELETEYELRFTLRLVLQPLAEPDVSTQDIPDRNVGAGVTHILVDLGLRYEIKREVALYLGGGGVCSSARPRTAPRRSAATEAASLCSAEFAARFSECHGNDGFSREDDGGTWPRRLRADLVGYRVARRCSTRRRPSNRLNQPKEKSPTYRKPASLPDEEENGAQRFRGDRRDRRQTQYEGKWTRMCLVELE